MFPPVLFRQQHPPLRLPDNVGHHHDALLAADARQQGDLVELALHDCVTWVDGHNGSRGPRVN